MLPVVVSAKNISKKYRLFNSPKERFFEVFHPFKRKFHREFWSLQDISFDIEKGQTLGIIGRNGAGKSTLLQIICSILKPTRGTITINGRVSALLSLGAGFNPEFTGRQNVMMNGVIMGLSYEEMKERMPAIEAFADIGDFIEQPMKIYSSGMSLRLAFASAINVDPDILVVDEAIAVGDARFQQKCYRKFIDFQNEGKTVIFVTHDTTAVTRHCHRAILLENGFIINDGKPNDVVNHYCDIIFSDKESFGNVPTIEICNQIPENCKDQIMKQGETELDKFIEEVQVSSKLNERKNYNKSEYRSGNRRAEFLDALTICSEIYEPAIIDSGDTLEIYTKVIIWDNIKYPVFGFEIRTVDGVYIYGTNTSLMKTEILPLIQGEIVIFKFSLTLNLSAGDYFITFGIGEEKQNSEDYEHEIIDARRDIIHIKVKYKGFFEGLIELATNYREISRKKALHR